MASDGLSVLLGRVATIENGSEETPVDGRLVHDQRIFLIVSGIATYGDTDVLSGRKFAEFDVLLENVSTT
jgi:hypothetical protein